MQHQVADIRVEPERPEHAQAVAALAPITGVCQDLEAERRKPYAQLWVALRGGVVGYVLFWQVADELQIVDLVTDPGQRRQGVGSAIVRSLLNYGRQRGCSALQLEVREQNHAAVALYEKFGFVTTRRRNGYYSNDNALEMMLSL